MIQKIMVVILLMQSISWAQRYQVIDSSLNQGVSFAKIYPQIAAPFLTDIDGQFELHSDESQIRIRALGYSDSIVNLAAVQNFQIFLHAKAQQTQEITVTPGVNPALRIIEKAIQNRKINHPQAHGGFIAEQYSKFVFDLDDDTRRRMADTVISPTDTNDYEFQQFALKQAFFISETVSKHYFEPPYREKESIEAFRVSGFTDPALSSIAQGLQSFHFYEIQLEILGLKYLSPLAPGSLNRYFFSLKDTTISGQDTTFTIFFKPKKGADFSGLTGYLYINTNGFAIEKVKAAPYNQPPNTNQVAITQEYQLLAPNIWFPKQLSTEISLPFVQLTFDSIAAVVVGRGLNVVRSVQFDPPALEKVKFDQVSVETLPNAHQKLTEEDWQKVRVAPLNEREITTFKQIDSLSEKYHFDQKLRFAKVLMAGKIPLGYVQLDLVKFLQYNAFEKTRIGVGIETSNRFSKYLVVGASVGYGLNDEQVKYTAFLSSKLNTKGTYNLKAFRSFDIVEMGAPVMYQMSRYLKQDAVRYLYAFNMAYQDKLGIEFSAQLKANQHLTLETNMQRNDYNDAYRYEGKSTSQLVLSRLTYSIAIREKSSYFGDLLLPKPSAYPKIQLQYEHAWQLSAWTDPNSSFNRFQVNIFQIATVPGRGVVNWNLRGSFTDRPTPLLYQHAISASKQLGSNALGLSVANTFETLGSTAFYHQQQVQFFFRYIQNAWRTKAKWNEPQIGVHFAYGWGRLADKAAHSATFLSMDKGYTEAGLLFNGLYVSGNSSFGIGLFSSFGYYSAADWKKNLVPKFSLGYVF